MSGTTPRRTRTITAATAPVAVTAADSGTGRDTAAGISALLAASGAARAVSCPPSAAAPDIAPGGTAPGAEERPPRPGEPSSRAA